MKPMDTPQIDTLENRTGCGSAAAACLPLPPIRTVEEFQASAREWAAAMICSTGSYDSDEVCRADAVCAREEARWEECRHRFIFDEDGAPVGLANARSAGSAESEKPTP